MARINGKINIAKTEDSMRIGKFFIDRDLLENHKEKSQEYHEYCLHIALLFALNLSDENETKLIKKRK